MVLFSMLKIFNTLTRQKEEFKPINTGKVNMYVCGITVYDLCHIGHGRTFMAFDFITRYLHYCGYTVNYVRNITDIDDKIICRAAKNRETREQLTDRMISEMYYDFDKLDILRPNHEPRVTHYIADIITFIEQLINKKHAYIASNGDVMFAVNSDINYGMLSRQNLEKLQTSARMEVTSIKLSPMDFVLWKISKGEPNWLSPWGFGRPGWHIECSTMNSIIMGGHCDIHGGGSDLIFPHHENEIAQSACADDGSFVNIWMHVGIVTVNNEKMSKSLGNFYTMRDVLKYYDAETIRYFLMSSHYRSQLHYSENNLKQARTALERLYIALRGTDITADPAGGEYFITKFTDAMNDDFNTPEAYSVLFEIAREINCLKTKKPSAVQGIAATLRHLANILGLLKYNPETFLQKKVKTEDTQITEIKELIQQRNDARKIRQWVVADQVRDKLLAMGIILEDGPQETIWRRSVGSTLKNTGGKDK